MKSIFVFLFLAVSVYAQTVLPVKTDATGLVVYPVTSSAFKTANGISGGTGTVTSVSVTTANGVSGTVATSTTTPAITLSLGAITPSSVNGLTLTGGTNTFTLTLGTSSLTVPAGVAFNANALLNVLANNTSTSANFGNVDATFHSINGVFIGNVGGAFGQLAIAQNKTLTASNSLTLAGTDSTLMTFPSTSATIARTDAANTFTGHQTIEGVTSTGATGTGNFVFSAAPTLTGHPTIEGVTSTGATGTGKFVFSASPTVTGLLSIGAVAGLTFNESGAIAQPFGAFSVDTSGNITSAQVDATGFNVKSGVLWMQSAAAGKYLQLQSTETLTANRALTIATGDAARTLTLTGSPSLSGFTATGTGTLALGAKTLTASNTLTFSGTDGSTLNVGTGGTLGTAAYTASTAYAASGANADITSTTALNTITAAASTNLSLNGGSSGGAFVIGQGANGNTILTLPGTGEFDLTGSSVAYKTLAVLDTSNASTGGFYMTCAGSTGFGTAMGVATANVVMLEVDSSSGGYIGNRRNGLLAFATNDVVRMTISAAGGIAITGSTTLGTGTAIKNIRHGISGAMVLGAVTVTDAGCTANTRYFFSAHTLGTISIPGGYYASTRTASTSFVITSSQPTETSTIDWMAIEP